MSPSASDAPLVSSHELVERLQALRGADACAALVFDGDGTLWSGDVGEDLFHFALREHRLRGACLPALQALARHYGTPTGDDAHAVASALFDGYRAGRVPERVACEMMTWVYAGHSADEVTALVDAALPHAQLATRRHAELDPVFEWARAEGLPRLLVSASPRFAVSHAAALWGFDAAKIVASDPALDASRVEPRLAHPVPYAEQKVVQARRVLGECHWLAAFGDNAFDVEMLGAARLAVAVRPKPRLLERLGSIRGALRLAAPGAAPSRT